MEDTMRGARKTTAALILSLIALSGLAVVVAVVKARNDPTEWLRDDLSNQLAAVGGDAKKAAAQANDLGERVSKSEQRVLALMDSVDRFRDQVAANTAAIETMSKSLSGMPGASWVEYTGNPVFVRDGPIGYPWVVYDPDRFGEGPDGPFYKMWYDGWEDGVTATLENMNCQIRLCVSNDGIHWTDKGKVSFADEAARPRACLHPCVLYMPGKLAVGADPYWLYYFDIKLMGIWLETSRDGLAWRPVSDEAVVSNSISDVEGFTGTIYGMWVTYDNGGTPIDVRDDRYSGWVDFEGRPFLISSTDGIHWATPGLRLFDGYFPREEEMVTNVIRVLRSKGGLFHMFYSYGDMTFNSPAPTGEGIGYMVAKEFERDGLPLRPARRVFHAADGVKWRNLSTTAPCVLYDPDDFSGHGDRVPYKMWFAGVSDARKSGVGYAVLRGDLQR